MANPTFDVIEEVSDSERRSPGGSGSLRPLFTVDLTNDEEVHKWVKNAKNYSVKYARNRNNNIRLNLELYSAKRGTATVDTENSSPNRTSLGGPDDYGYPLVSGVIVNHLYDLTENRVSRYVEYRPIIDLSPRHSTDPKDRFAAKANKDFLDYIRDMNNLDDLNASFSRSRIIAGEAYLFVEWDPDKGYLQPEVKAIMDSGEVPVLDATITGEQPAESLANFRVGDVSFRVPDTRNIFLAPEITGEYERVSYLFERSLRDADELRAEYPDYAHKIESNTDKATPFLYDDGSGSSIDNGAGDLWFSEILPASNQVELWTLWHKPTRYLPNGRKVVFTDRCILENSEDPYFDATDPYPNNGFPIRVTDIDVEGDLYGTSVYVETRSLNEYINKLYTVAYRNQQLVGNPKWMVPENSRVSKEALGNDVTIVRYSGEKEPKLEVFSNTPKELFALIQSMEQNLFKLFGFNPVSQGDIPPGMESGIALRYLSEAEKARQNTQTIKQNNFIKALFEKTLAVARRFYSPDDQRLMKIWGKDYTFETSIVNPLSLSTPCEVRIRESSLVSESKAAKTQFALDIDQRRPLEPDVFAEAVDLGIPEAHMNEISYAKKRADFNETVLLTGQPVAPPEETEDLLTHWQRGFIGFQSSSYQALPPELREPKRQHMAAIEQMLMAKAFINNDMMMPANPALAQILTSNPNFPCIFKPNRDMLNFQAQAAAANPMAALAIQAGADPNAVMNPEPEAPSKETE